MSAVDRTDQIRREFSEVAAARSKLKATDFAQIYELEKRADALRSELAELLGPELAGAQREWAEGASVNEQDPGHTPTLAGAVVPDSGSAG